MISLRLCSFQEQRLRYLKMQEQQQREQEKLRLLHENAENQEAKLRRVRALKGQVEQKRLSNSKLGQKLFCQIFKDLNVLQLLPWDKP